MTKTGNEFDLALPPIHIVSILEKIILGGIVFILALPLLGDYGLWFFPIGRDVIFKIAVEALFLLYFVKLVFVRDSAPRLRGWIPISLLTFWVVMGVSTLVSVQPGFSLWGNMYKNQGLLTWTHYVLFFLLLLFFLNDKKRWQLLIHIAIGVASTVSLIALWQMIQHDFVFRVSATLNNSNFLAAYLVLLLPVTFAHFLAKRSWWLAGAALLQLMALLFTQTRGGYIGLFATILTFALLYGFPNTRDKPSRAFGATRFIPIVAAFFALLIFTPPGQTLQQRLPDFTDRFLVLKSIKSTAGPRIEAWRAGWQGILKKPLLGYGPENFFVVYDEHYSGLLDTELTPVELSPWEAWFDKAHNFIFDIGSTMGFLGLLAYIAIFFSAVFLLLKNLQITPARRLVCQSLDVGGSLLAPFRSLWQRMGEGENYELRITSIGIIATITGYLTQNLLGFDTTVPGIYLMFLLAYAEFTTHDNPQTPLQVAPSRFVGWGKKAILALYAKAQRFLPLLSERRTLQSPAMTLLIIPMAVLLVASLKIHLDILNANHQLNLAEVLARSGRIEESFTAFEKGLEYKSPPINPNLRRRYAVVALGYHDAVDKRCRNTDGKNGLEKFSAEKCEWLYNDAKKRLTRALDLQQENAAREWPRFTRNYIYAAQIANILGRYEESNKYFESALRLSPKRKSVEGEWSRLRNLRKEL